MPSPQPQIGYYSTTHDITHDSFYYPAHEVQKPTINRIHVRSAEDAHVVFEAVRMGARRPVCRRLNDAERSMYIRSGSVFVWQETEDSIGLRRWTDGLVWSASRMREPFLFYETRNKLPGSSSPGSSADQNIPGLVKQTYSAIVVGDGSDRKWHLTAYFSHADYDKLPTVADDPFLRTVVVPKGMYRSGKSRQSVKSLQSQWAGLDRTSLDSQSGASMGYESCSPVSSPTLSYRGQPSSPYSSRPSSSHRSSLPSSPYPQQPFPYSQPITSRSSSIYPCDASPTHTHHSSSQPPSPFQHGTPNPHAPQPGLPPLHAALPDPRSTFSTGSSRVASVEARTAEDQRMLQLFNTKHLK